MEPCCNRLLKEQLSPIDSYLSLAPCVLFIRGTRNRPIGSYSQSAVRILSDNNVPFETVDITNMNKKAIFCLIKYSGWHLFPQFFVNKEFIGGSYILPEFIRSGELSRLLTRIKYNDFMSYAGLANRKDGSVSKHRGPIWRMSLSPDNKYICTASADTTAKEWSVRTEQLQRTLIGHTSWVNCAAYTNDSKSIVTGSSDTTVKIWPREFGDNEITHFHHSRWVNDITIAKNNLIASVSADGHIVLCDIEQKCIRKIESAHCSCIWSVCYIQEAQWLATSSSDGMIAVWNIGTSKLVDCFLAHDGCITDLCPKTHYDGFYSVSYDGYIKSWSLNGKMITKAFGHKERIWSISESPCGNFLATASADHTVKLWNSQLKLQETFRFSDMPVSCQLVIDHRKICVGHKSGALSWVKI